MNLAFGSLMVPSTFARMQELYLYYSSESKIQRYNEGDVKSQISIKILDHKTLLADCGISR
jgi:hypothetical protein